jgi:hypothetical protein
MALSPEEKKRRQLERRQKKYNDTHKIINGEIYKLCTKHHEHFPDEDECLPSTEEYFYPNKSNGIDGLSPYCIKCSRKRALKYKNQHLEEYKIRRKIYKEKNLEKEKEYNRNWNNNHKEIMKENNKQWQKNNKDKLKIYNKKAQNKEHTISKQEWEECKKYFNYKCAYCGFPLEDHYIKYRNEIRKSDFHKEHVQHDGAKDLSNCIPACRHCNVSKHTEDMEVWFRKQEYFSGERLNKIYKWLNEDHKQYIKPPKPKGKYVRKNKDNN